MTKDRINYTPTAYIGMEPLPLAVKCDECGSYDVEVGIWVNANTGEHSSRGGRPTDLIWCTQCKSLDCEVDVEGGTVHEASELLPPRLRPLSPVLDALRDSMEISPGDSMMNVLERALGLIGGGVVNHVTAFTKSDEEVLACLDSYRNEVKPLSAIVRMAALVEKHSKGGRRGIDRGLNDFINVCADLLKEMRDAEEAGRRLAMDAGPMSDAEIERTRGLIENGAGDFPSTWHPDPVLSQGRQLFQARVWMATIDRLQRQAKEETGD